MNKKQKQKYYNIIVETRMTKSEESEMFPCRTT